MVTPKVFASARPGLGRACNSWLDAMHDVIPGRNLQITISLLRILIVMSGRTRFRGWGQKVLHPRNLVVERLPEIPFLRFAGDEARPYLQAVAGARAVHPPDH